MQKELPKYHETFIPILEVLKDGGLLRSRELCKQVRDRFYANLPVELLEQKTKNGELLILSRIGWGIAYLKQAKIVEQPERAFVQITQKGKDILEKGGITLKDVLKDHDFLSHRSEKKSNIKQNTLEDENASPQDMIDSGIQSIENQTKSELLEKLKKIDPYYFEKIVLKLMEAMGYGDFIETKKSNDGGIDGIINQDQLGLEKIYVQAKRYGENKVRETDIRNFIGAMSGDTQKGVFVTTSTFDDHAIKKAHDAHHKIILIDGKKIVDLMYKFNVGVQNKNVYEIKQIDEDFYEVN